MVEAIKLGGLADLQAQPDLLIPHELLTMVSDPIKVIAIPFRIERGRFNNEYIPPLSMLIIEKNGLAEPLSQQEQGHYTLAPLLNQYRTLLIERGVLHLTDKALVLLIANQWAKNRICPDSGVYIEDYVQAWEFQNRGLGKAFFTNFERHLGNLGFNYWCGNHNGDNVGFFLKLGAVRASCLNAQFDHQALRKRPTSSIKFLDEETHRRYLDS